MSDPPDDTLQRLLRDFWSQQLDDHEPETAMLDEDADNAQVWSDRKGDRFRPLLLSGRKQGEPLAAGVVLLAGAAREALRAHEIALLTAAANALLDTEW
jgi:hypothetical protein